MHKYLIIYAHPSHDGHNGYMLKAISKLLEEKSANFKVIDLYKINWNPSLKDDELYSSNRRAVAPETKALQEDIKSASRLIFIYPTWWQNMPAILKGFFDRVFVSLFGFTYKKIIPVGLLKGRRAAAFTTTSGPGLFFLLIGRPSLRLVTRYILFFCGITSKGFFLAGAKGRNLEKNKLKLDKIAKRIVRYLDKDIK